MSHSEKKVDFDPNTRGLSYKFNKMCIDREVVTTNKKKTQDCDKMVIRHGRNGRNGRNVNKLRRYRSEPYAATELIRAPSVTTTTDGNSSPYPVKYLDFNNIK